MPFPPINLSPSLASSLTSFAKLWDFAELYKGYHWGIDTWENGFPNILRLEADITEAAKNDLIGKEQVLSVVSWGKLRNPASVKCPETFSLQLYENERPHREIAKDPARPLRALAILNIKGLGPTYLSKILRFALPQEFGAIDTRIVRVTGVGDPDSKKCAWLALKTRNDGYGWYIPKNQPAWPNEYPKWINILRFLAHDLNSSRKVCPHPANFVKTGLRQPGTWACADVEMALFSYASKHLAPEGDAS